MAAAFLNGWQQPKKTAQPLVRALRPHRATPGAPSYWSWCKKGNILWEGAGVGVGGHGLGSGAPDWGLGACVATSNTKKDTHTPPTRAPAGCSAIPPRRRNEKCVMLAYGLKGEKGGG